MQATKRTSIILTHYAVQTRHSVRTAYNGNINSNNNNMEHGTVLANKRPSKSPQVALSPRLAPNGTYYSNNSQQPILHTTALAYAVELYRATPVNYTEKNNRRHASAPA